MDGNDGIDGDLNDERVELVHGEEEEEDAFFYTMAKKGEEAENEECGQVENTLGFNDLSEIVQDTANSNNPLIQVQGKYLGVVEPMLKTNTHIKRT